MYRKRGQPICFTATDPLLPRRLCPFRPQVLHCHRHRSPAVAGWFGTGFSMHYFSYGSNMSTKRLRARVPSAERVAAAMLEGHALKFHKVSVVDGSAKCDAIETGNPNDFVHGVLFRISPLEKPCLDRNEGLGIGYDEKIVCVRLSDGSSVAAFTYYATRIDPDLKPFDWYKTHVLVGARENGLPPDYVTMIEAVQCVEDTHAQRRARELSIYR